MKYYGAMEAGGAGGYYRPGLFRGFSFFPPVIKWLFIVNISLWFLFEFLLAPLRFDGVSLGGPLGILQRPLLLWPIGDGFWPWQLVTYMFLHGGFFHLFFNMLALWMFGMELENLWGSKKFLVCYLLCGLGGGLAHLLISPLIGMSGPMVGASGSVFGILVAFGYLFPTRPIYIYFLLPIPAKYFVLGYITLELVYGVAGTADGIAHFAHLGGAAVGLVYVLSELRVLPLSSMFSRFAGQVKNPFGKGYGGSQGGSVGRIYEGRFRDVSPSSRKENGDKGITQDQIDAILDKIALGGYQSLSDEEKKILTAASRRMN
jgi:membrane associated rhomboid family serine protease